VTPRGKTIALALVLIVAFIVLRIVAPTVAGWIIVGCVGWSMCRLAEIIVSRRAPKRARR
jgi:hypothetical protein